MSDENMKIDPARAKALAEAFRSVEQRVVGVAMGRSVRIVAVSKLKPASDILALHQSTGHVHFGENYAQELMEKAEILPRSIQWHFIGGLQSNKCKSLASSIPNLFLVSSVDTEKKATLLSTGRGVLRSSQPSSPSTYNPPNPLTASTTPQSTVPPLNIHIQINTSGESSKSGVSPGPATTALAKHILTSCPHLHLLGLMTIGAIARSHAAAEGEENEDFVTLVEERKRLVEELREAGLLGGKEGGDGEEGKEGDGDDSRLEVSMGMSEDFEEAVRWGSGEVRVGSTVFGERPSKEDAVV